eukprot:703546-Hanusia_phi.AAC.1
MKYFRRPESLGIVVGTVHMICVIIFQVYYYTVADAASVWKVKLEEYNAALAATIFMMLVLTFVPSPGYDVLGTLSRCRMKHLVVHFHSYCFSPLFHPIL